MLTHTRPNMHAHSHISSYAQAHARLLVVSINCIPISNTNTELKMYHRQYHYPMILKLTQLIDQSVINIFMAGLRSNC